MNEIITKYRISNEIAKRCLNRLAYDAGCKKICLQENVRYNITNDLRYDYDFMLCIDSQFQFNIPVFTKTNYISSYRMSKKRSKIFIDNHTYYWFLNYILKLSGAGNTIYWCITGLDLSQPWNVFMKPYIAIEEILMKVDLYE